MTIQQILLQVAAAFIGTVAFSILFGVPKGYYLMCGLNAAFGWLIYCIFTVLNMSITECTFFATLFVILFARFAAVYKSCPITVFLTTGIFPLIPGAGIYWTTYYLVQGDGSAALSAGFQAVKSVIAIVLGIVIVLEIPNKVFLLAKRKQKVTKADSGRN